MCKQTNKISKHYNKTIIIKINKIFNNFKIITDRIKNNKIKINKIPTFFYRKTIKQSLKNNNNLMKNHIKNNSMNILKSKYK